MVGSYSISTATDDDLIVAPGWWVVGLALVAMGGDVYFVLSS
jgi:hypothetical protein